MKIKVSHENIYEYDSPVFLESHIIKLHPRNEPSQLIKVFNIKIEPNPVCITKYLDVEGNFVIQTWFNDLTDYLKVETNFEIETSRENPFDFYTDPIDLQFPFEYQQNLTETIQPYIKKQLIHDISLKNFINGLEKDSKGNIFDFLILLNQQINEFFKYKIREEGEPYSAEKTFSLKEGSCRDFAMFFIEVCRQKGIAARFMSGYRHSKENKGAHYLHAWVEVYIPGGGWRGFDPTEGIAIDKNYIALAASYDSQNTLPIVGTTRSKNAKSSFTSKIFLED